MSIWNSMLSWVEHEKFYNRGAWVFAGHSTPYRKFRHALAHLIVLFKLSFSQGWNSLMILELSNYTFNLLKHMPFDFFIQSFLFIKLFSKMKN